MNKLLKNLAIATLISLGSASSYADNKKVEIEPVISLPSGHFFENLTFLNNDELIATDYTGMSLYKYSEDGQAQLWSKVKGHPVSIRFDSAGNGLLAVHETPILAGAEFVNSMALYRADTDGKLTRLISLDFPAFLNGMAVLDEGKFLIGDALNGRIYQYNLSTNELTTWYENDLLKPLAERPGLPGVNGIQMHNGDLYLTNSAQTLLAKISIKDNKATGIEVLNKSIQADDFTIDAENNWFITTHHHQIIKFTSDGEVIVVLEHGVEGNTAIQKSNRADNLFYVTNDGGLLFGSKGNAGLSKLTF